MAKDGQLDADYIVYYGQLGSPLLPEIVALRPVMIHDLPEPFWLNYEAPFTENVLREGKALIDLARPPWFSTGVGASAEPQAHRNGPYREADDSGPAIPQNGHCQHHPPRTTAQRLSANSNRVGELQLPPDQRLRIHPRTRIIHSAARNNWLRYAARLGTRPDQRAQYGLAEFAGISEGAPIAKGEGNPPDPPRLGRHTARRSAPTDPSRRSRFARLGLGTHPRSLGHARSERTARRCPFRTTGLAPSISGGALRQLPQG